MYPIVYQQDHFISSFSEAFAFTSFIYFLYIINLLHSQKGSKIILGIQHSHAIWTFITVYNNNTILASGHISLHLVSVFFSTNFLDLNFYYI